MIGIFRGVIKVVRVAMVISIYQACSCKLALNTCTLHPCGAKLEGQRAASEHRTTPLTRFTFLRLQLSASVGYKMSVLGAGLALVEPDLGKVCIEDSRDSMGSRGTSGMSGVRCLS